MNADPISARHRLLDQRAVTPPHVVHRQFAEETVVLNLNTGHYHGLNATGGAMLDVLVSSRSIEAAVAGLAERYGRPHSEIEADVLDFIEQLLERDLLALEAPR